MSGRVVRPRWSPVVVCAAMLSQAFSSRQPTSSQLEVWGGGSWWWTAGWLLAAAGCAGATVALVAHQWIHVMLWARLRTRVAPVAGVPVVIMCVLRAGALIRWGEHGQVGPAAILLAFAWLVATGFGWIILDRPLPKPTGGT